MKKIITFILLIVLSVIVMADERIFKINIPNNINFTEEDIRRIVREEIRNVVKDEVRDNIREIENRYNQNNNQNNYRGLTPHGTYDSETAKRIKATFNRPLGEYHVRQRFHYRRRR